ncbi:MAG TPA: ABC transporter permease [Actinomycetes bacterium]|jgi:simple sugar transport system permease protein|nr:ABC transporter permease [Actinomycetes bacterium]
MSLVGTPPPATEPEAEVSRWNWHLPRTGWPFVLLALAGLIVLMSIIRVITGADDLTSSGTIASALALSVPIGMAGLGGLWSERSGVVNIGLEGMMILGTWGAGWAGYQWGAWTGVLVGIAMGAVGGLVHAVATVTFGVDHIVSGVAINILGLGVTQYLSVIAFQGVPGAGQSQSPPTPDIQTVSIPGLSDPLLTLQNKHWFLVSDLAGIARGLLTGVSLLTVVAVLLLFVTYLVLWRTPFGLRLRACGESPTAAESLGVNVYLMKYWAVIASGAFAGLGGAFLAIVAGNGYREGQTGGRGYIGLAAMIFGNWRPGGLAAGAALFGYTDSLQLRSGDSSVHALLLLIGVPLVGYAVWAAYRQKFITAVFAVVVGAAALVWYFSTDAIPGDFTTMTPYVTTLLVLALASQRLRPPAADGLPYRRGQGG